MLVGRALGSLLIGVQPLAVTYLVVLTLMAAVALIACTLPACLAASINPIATLHEE